MISRFLMHSTHQTWVSRSLRRVPGVASVASAWWLNRQSDSLKWSIEAIRGPRFGNGRMQESPDIPSLVDVEERDRRTVEMGQAFSLDMEQWCQTSKFRSLGYHDVYARCVQHMRSSSIRILEIGIGVNDPSAASGMSVDHFPGASLRGWANYFPDAEVFGADVDRRVLGDNPDYTAFWVDQRDKQSLQKLAEVVGGPLDLVVDDGLHTAEANGNTLEALLPLLAPAGVMVIEDILPEYNDLWTRVPMWLRPEYEMRFFPGEILRSDRPEGMAVFWRKHP